jgi:uncharacterized FlgJ-related protein
VRRSLSFFEKLAETYDREEDEILIEPIVVFIGDILENLREEERAIASKIVKQAMKKFIDNSAKISNMRMRNIIDRPPFWFFFG